MMKVHHIGYLVKNIEKSVKAFKVLGFEEISYVDEFITDDPYRKCYICFLKNGEYVVELISPKDDTSPVYGLMSKYKNSPYHICYESDNIDEDIEALKKEGYVIFKDLQIAPALADKNVVFLMNQNAGIIEIVDNKN